MRQFSLQDWVLTGISMFESDQRAYCVTTAKLYFLCKLSVNIIVYFPFQQTDKIEVLEKWTQRPPAASIQAAEKDFDLFMQNVRGCGGQVVNPSFL